MAADLGRPDVCTIGALSSAEASAVRLLEVNTRGEWHRTSTAVDPDAITRFDLEGGYEQALQLVAGDPLSDDD